MPKEKPNHPIGILDKTLVRAFEKKEPEDVESLLDIYEYELNKLLPLASGKRATFLHLAILSESLPIIKLLVERGADVFAKDSLGRTPRDVAIQKGFTETDVAKQKVFAEIAAYLESRVSGEEKADVDLGAGREPPLHTPMFLGSAIAEMLLNIRRSSPEGVLHKSDIRSLSSGACGVRTYRPGYESWLRDPDAYEKSKRKVEEELHGR